MTPKRFGQLLKITEHVPGDGPEGPLGGPEHYKARGMTPPAAPPPYRGSAGQFIDKAEVCNILRKEGLDAADPESMFAVAEHLNIDPYDDDKMAELQRAFDEISGELGDAGV